MCGVRTRAWMLLVPMPEASRLYLRRGMLGPIGMAGDRWPEAPVGVVRVGVRPPVICSSIEPRRLGGCTRRGV